MSTSYDDPTVGGLGLGHGWYGGVEFQTSLRMARNCMIPLGDGSVMAPSAEN